MARLASGHAFISYSGWDRALAKRLSDALKVAGVDARSALDVSPVADWQAELMRTLEDSSVVVVVVTPRGVSSGWVNDQWAAGVGGAMRLLAVLADNAPVSDLPPKLSRNQVRLRDASFDQDVLRIADKVRLLARADKPAGGTTFELRSAADDAVGQELLGLGVEDVGTRSDAQNHPDIVFVLTAYSSDMDEAFIAVKNAAKECDLTAMRAVDQIGDDRVHDTLLESIRDAGMIVADLTNERPNVYFELGYARGLNKTVVTVAREGTMLHFNVADYRCLIYRDRAQLEDVLIRRFKVERAAPASGEV